MLGLLAGTIVGIGAIGESFKESVWRTAHDQSLIERALANGEPPYCKIGNELINMDTGGKIKIYKLGDRDRVALEYAEDNNYQIYNYTQRERIKNNEIEKAKARREGLRFYYYDADSKLCIYNNPKNKNKHYDVCKHVDDDETFYMSMITWGMYGSPTVYINIETGHWFFENDEETKRVIPMRISTYGEKETVKKIQEQVDSRIKFCGEDMKEYIKVLREYERKQNRSYKEWKEVNMAYGMKVKRRTLFPVKPLV